MRARARSWLVLASLAAATAGCPLTLSDYTIGEPGPADGSVVDAATEKPPADAPAPDTSPLPDGGCPGTTTLCGKSCYDLTSDPSHCGSCTKACLSGHACSASACQGWASVASAGMTARKMAASCALPSGQIFVWGGADDTGAINTGGIYDAASDTWTTVTVDGSTPTARVLATAVCFADRVLVWGGGDEANANDYKDGAVYDVKSKSWSVTSNVCGGLKGQRMAYGALLGSSAMIYGGVDKTGKAVGGPGCLYDPGANAWTQPSSNPAAVTAPGVDASASAFYAFGGTTNVDTNALWVMQSGSWTTASSSGAPAARTGPFAAWDSSRLVIWGGTASGAAIASGARYASSWQGMTTTSAPSARSVSPRRAGWSAAIGATSSLHVGGVLANNNLAHDGGVYDSATDSWKTIPSWLSTDDHEWGVAAWTGKELVVWGGLTGSKLVATGDRFAPAP